MVSNLLDARSYIDNEDYSALGRREIEKNLSNNEKIRQGILDDDKEDKNKKTLDKVDIRNIAVAERVISQYSESLIGKDITRLIDALAASWRAAITWDGELTKHLSAGDKEDFFMPRMKAYIKKYLEENMEELNTEDFAAIEEKDGEGGAKTDEVITSSKGQLLLEFEESDKKAA